MLIDKAPSAATSSPTRVSVAASSGVRTLSRADDGGTIASRDRAEVSRESKEQPRGLLSGLLHGLSENYGHVESGAAKVVSGARSTVSSLKGSAGKVKSSLQSPETHVKVDAVERSLRSVSHAGAAARDLASDTSRVLKPEKPVSGRSGKDDSEIKVTSWNLHHGSSQDKDGARDQISQQIARLKDDGADITLLQEVLPWQAKEIVEKTGKVGYYSQTTPRQGNMILVDPELQVQGNRRDSVNHEVPRGNLMEGLKTAWAPGGKEPRAAQALRIARPDGKGSFSVFNTHLSTDKATARNRVAEDKKFETFVAKSTTAGEPVIGGGDLNMGRNNPMVESFRQKGYTVSSALIDHLASKGASRRTFQAGDQYADGQRLSDHPLITGTYTLP